MNEADEQAFQRVTDPRRAYMTDPVFKMVVDSLEAVIQRAQLTPNEVRAAAMQACINYEMKTTRPFVVALPDQRG